MDRPALVAALKTHIIGRPLESYVAGRDNNLNLIRMLAATAVLVSHSFGLTRGTDLAEPFKASTGLTLGNYAVAVFFGISGLLISRSFDRRMSLAHFAAARFLRVFPGLLVVLVLSAFVLGPAVTELPLSAYFGSSVTWRYVPQNWLLAFPEHYLPGVFARNPAGGSVNGSLWSLYYEVICYCVVVVIGFIGAFRRKWLFVVFLLLASAGHVASVLNTGGHGIWYKLDTLGFFGFPFALGMAAYAFRNHLPIGFAGILIGWSAAALLSQTPFLAAALMAALVYTTLVIAYLPKGRLRQYNRLGDYSYGIYIYAFPIQQAVIALRPDMGMAENLAWAIPITLALAIASWFLVEMPSLAKVRLVGNCLAGTYRRNDALAAP